jgi:oxygen-independent coproporphyrinogen-3 oxidase
MLERAELRLVAAGYERYELSNYARPGHRARHNRRYWERRPVLGLGVGAVSTDPPGPGAPFGIRRANARRLDVYLERIAAGDSAEAGPPEVLDARTARGEAAFLALRCAEGLDADGFRREFGAAPRGFWGREIDALVAGELLSEASDGSLRLTRRGRLVSDGVFESFV